MKKIPQDESVVALHPLAYPPFLAVVLPVGLRPHPPFLAVVPLAACLLCPRVVQVLQHARPLCPAVAWLSVAAVTLNRVVLLLVCPLCPAVAWPSVVAVAGEWL